MFAVLGEIAFEVVGSPESFETDRRYDFAEHRVIEAKPRLQWLANDLERLKMDIMLHASIADPSAQLSALRQAASAHRALALVFGNGVFRGLFVIESIGVRPRQFSAIGAPIAIAVALTLTEAPVEAELDATGPLLPDVPPIGVSLPGPIGGSDEVLTGVSALLSLSAASGPDGPSLQASDVPVAAIVRRGKVQ